MKLVLDAGNTRLKWALVRGGSLVDSGSRAYREPASAPLLAEPEARGESLELVLVANVAGSAVARRLAEESRARFGLEPEFVVPRACEHGVRSAYAEPERLGVDRWVGLIAAHRLATGSACVISAGTAATFDAVDAHGQHLGGLIVPGPRLMAEALAQNTSQIGATEPAHARPAGLDVLGKSTAEAVGRGALLAIATAFDRAVAIATLALGERPSVFLTGGDAEVLLAWLESDVQVRADLALEGLAMISEA
jgi:type III pantothenate kinase